MERRKIIYELRTSSGLVKRRGLCCVSSFVWSGYIQHGLVNLFEKKTNEHVPTFVCVEYENDPFLFAFESFEIDKCIYSMFKSHNCLQFGTPSMNSISNIIFYLLKQIYCV